MNEPVAVEKIKIKKLLELNEELENYFRNTIIPQLFVDSDLILRKFSPPANVHLKLVPEHIGKSVYDIPNLAELPDFVDSINKVIATNEDLELEIQTNDKRWFQMNILPYIIRKQNITNGVVITFIDITGRINDKQDIERINADHETFIYSVSHDFRGPLTNMVMLIELLKSAIGNNETKDIHIYMDKISGSAHSLNAMLNELTDITKIETDLNGERALVSVSEILEEVKFTLKNQIYQSHAKITSNLMVPDLHFSRKNLRSILYNLLSNAIKYATPGKTPEIAVHTEDSGDFILLSVQDNGVGIEEEKQQEIFSKFTRLLPHIEGTGVGLFIVSKMVTGHGGKIEVASKRDKGTTFRIYLKR